MGARPALPCYRAGETFFSERSVDAVAIDDIVQAAGVAKGSSYNYFDDKTSFASTICVEIRQEIEELVIEAPGRTSSRCRAG